MDTGITIRKAAAEDEAALRALDSVLPDDSRRAGQIANWLSDDVVLIAERGGTPMGYGVLNHSFFERGLIVMLMVRMDCRRQGIGRSLCLALERFCKSPKLFSTTNRSNEPMQRLLARVGFRECGFIDDLDPGDPELVFVKTLKF